MPGYEHDGVQLFYEDTGTGDSVILLHGGGCNSSHWQAQVEHLCDRYRVIVPHLRAHGRSATPSGEYTMEVFAGDVAALCTDLAVSQSVVIGHSLGGVVAWVLAARHPELTRAVGALDSPLLVSDEEVAAMQALATTVAQPGYLDELSRQVRNQIGDTAPDIQDKILSGYAHIAPEALASLARHVYSNTFADAIAACAVPALYVASAIPTDVDRLRRLCPQVEVGRVVGAGHFVTLEVPAQVNAMLDRFLALVQQSDGPTVGQDA